VLPVIIVGVVIREIVIVAAASAAVLIIDGCAISSGKRSNGYINTIFRLLVVTINFLNN